MNWIARGMRQDAILRLISPKSPFVYSSEEITGQSQLFLHVPFAGQDGSMNAG